MFIKLKAYIALHGRSTWATLNTYYAMLKETDYRPDAIWIFTESSYEDQLPVLDEGLRIISIGYDFQPKISSRVVPEGEIIDAALEIGGLVSSLKKDHEVAMDITSARKSLVVGAILSTANFKLDRIFYLMIDTLQDASKPYPMIPRQHHSLVDFQKQIRSNVK